MLTSFIEFKNFINGASIGEYVNSLCIMAGIGWSNDEVAFDCSKLIRKIKRGKRKVVLDGRSSLMKIRCVEHKDRVGEV